MSKVIPVTKERLYGLDHLRALAITMVLFYHYRGFHHGAWIDKTMGFGWAGVDLFFVLSGYLIASPLFARMANGKKISVPEFYIKRFFRIIPLYLFLLVIYFLFPAFHEKEALPPLWKFLTFTQNFGFDIKNYGTFSHVWSLCVEEHFYLFFPLILLIFIRFKNWRKGWIVLLTLFGIGFVLRFGSWHYLVAPHKGQPDFGILWYRFIYYPTYNRLDGLLAGVTIAALFNFKPAIKARLTQNGHLVLLSGLLVLTASWFLCRNQQTFAATLYGFPLVSIGFGLLVIAALSPRCFLYRINSPATTLIAKLSYALYLAHKGIIHIVQPLIAKTGLDPKSNLMLVLCFSATLLGAYMLNKVIETPFLQLRQSILERRRAKRTRSQAMVLEERRL